jgi:hypothetical protein
MSKGTLPTSRCFECGYMPDDATCPDAPHERPSEGDYTVCLNCGAIAKFNHILTMIRIPKPELDAMDTTTRNQLEHYSNEIKQRGRLK